MTNKTDHTALPWGTEKGSKCYVICAKHKPYDVAVVRDIGDENNKANAHYIVKAANYHYRLVEALNGLFDMWDGPLYMEWEKARALLAEL